MFEFFRYITRSWGISSSASLNKFTLLRLTDPKFSEGIALGTLQKMVRKGDDPDGLISKWRMSRFCSALKLFWCVRKDSCESTQRGLLVAPNRNGLAVCLMQVQPSQDTISILAAAETDCGLPETASDVGAANARLAKHQDRFHGPKR